jgi:hypothetical protein
MEETTINESVGAPIAVPDRWSGASTSNSRNGANWIRTKLRMPHPPGVDFTAGLHAELNVFAEATRSSAQRRPLLSPAHELPCRPVHPLTQADTDVASTTTSSTEVIAAWRTRSIV